MDTVYGAFERSSHAHGGKPFLDLPASALPGATKPFEFTYGEAAGGDKRGKQSAALLLHSREDYAALDIRADDHAEPIDELFRLYEVAHQRYLPFSQAFATRANPVGVTDRSKIEEEVARWLQARADEGGPGRI